MSLTIYLGPMCSGKTTTLLNIYKNNNNNCIIINSSIDTRTKNTGIWTHDGKQFDGNVIYTDKIMKDNIISDLIKYDIILINEAQFIEDLNISIKHLVDILNKKVIIGALDGDYNRKPFLNVQSIIPYADNILKLKAKCSICNKKAPFTYKRPTNNNQQIEIGGTNIYKPLCRTHYNEKMGNLLISNTNTYIN
jgi:thymidine kinase